MSPPAPSAADIDVGAIQRGERGAFVVLADVWLDRMHDAAQNIVGSADAATEICAGVFGLLWSRHADVAPSDVRRESLLLATRARALAHLDRHGWGAPADHGGVGHSGSAASAIGGPTTGHRVVLAHAAATVLGARTVSAVDLHYRHGVDAAALARALSVTSEESLRRLVTLRDEFGEVVAAFGLWNAGRPACANLAQALGGVAPFGDDVFERIGRHRVTCPECARRYRSLVNPASMFIAAPVRNVAPSVRQRALAAITDPAAGTTPAVVDPAVVAAADTSNIAESPPAEPSPASESPSAAPSTSAESSPQSESWFQSESSPQSESWFQSESSFPSESLPESESLPGSDSLSASAGDGDLGDGDLDDGDLDDGDLGDGDLDDLWGPTAAKAAAATAAATSATMTTGPDVSDIWETTTASRPEPSDAAAASRADGSDDTDLEDLWTTPAAPARPAAPATPAAPARPATVATPATPARVESTEPRSPADTTIVAVGPDRDRRRRGVVALVAGAAAVAVVTGGAALSLSGSGGRGPAAVEPVSDLDWPPVDDDEPEVRSLGPIPPTTQPSTTLAQAGSTTPTTTIAPTTTDPLPVELSERSELFVVAANGASVARAAGNMATQLEAIDYVGVVPLDGTDIFEFTVVYYADGLEEAALRMADDLFLLPEFVAPIDDAPVVADLPLDVELLVYIGRDRA